MNNNTTNESVEEIDQKRVRSKNVIQIGSLSQWVLV